MSRLAGLALAALVTGCATTPPPAATNPPPATYGLSPGAFVQDRGGLVPSDAEHAAADVADTDVEDSAELGDSGDALDVATVLGEAPEPVYIEDEQDLRDEVDGGALAGSGDEANTVWPELRRGFALPDKNHPRVAPHIQWFVSHPTYIERTFQRAEPFLHYILSETQRRGIPTEIALLPVVESAFQPFAYSHGRASGIWQFIPGTAKRYGLKINWWHDGRRDIKAATDAALNYLQMLSNYFNGDWLLALAAYNSGEGNVARAVERNRLRGKSTEFWDLDLPKETRGYVPRLLAISAIVANPQAYGVALQPIRDDHYFTPVATDSQIDLSLAAELAKMPLEQFYHLNPAHNRWASDPSGPHELLLPLDRAADFSINLGQLDDANRVQWHRHTIKKGETLGQIASRYRMTAGLLREVNGLKSDRLRVGQHLLIPTGPQAALRVAGGSVPGSASTAAGPVRETTVHKVRAGESLWSISRKYGVSVARLAEWNDMSARDPLKVGKSLVVGAAPQTVSAGPGIRRSISLPPTAEPQRIRYTVRKGDSLYRIAQRFNVTVNKLLQWNSAVLSGKKPLRPGQVLTLFVDITDADARG